MSLQTIYLSNCIRLESLPSSLYKLKCLQDSYLDDCPNLHRLPDELGSFEALRGCMLKENAVTEVPWYIIFQEMQSS